MSKPNFMPEGYHSLTPYVCFENCTAALEFYEKALGAKVLFKMPMPDGKIAHAEFKIGNSHIMCSDEAPQMGAFSAKHFKGSPVSFMIYVEDVDQVATAALKAGMTVKREIQNQFYGDRSGTYADPFGYTWTIATHVEDVSPEELKARTQKLFGSKPAT